MEAKENTGHQGLTGGSPGATKCPLLVGAVEVGRQK